MFRTMISHALVGLVLSVLFTCCGMLFLNWPVNRAVQTWEQPNEIEYEQNSKYKLFVREKCPDWSLFAHRNARHEIFISRDGSYGHWFDCTFHAGSLDGDKIDAYIRRSTVEWTKEGVSITQESGHAVFFPKKTFIGGR